MIMLLIIQNQGDKHQDITCIGTCMHTDSCISAYIYTYIHKGIHSCRNITMYITCVFLPAYIHTFISRISGFLYFWNLQNSKFLYFQHSVFLLFQSSIFLELLEISGNSVNMYVCRQTYELYVNVNLYNILGSHTVLAMALYSDWLILDQGQLLSFCHSFI